MESKLAKLPALDKSSLLTFLDRFFPPPWAKDSTFACSSVDTLFFSGLEKQWWSKAQERIKELLLVCGLELTLVDDHTVHLTAKASGETLSAPDIAALTSDIEYMLLAKNVFQYDEWVQANLQAGIRELQRKPYVVEKKLVDPELKGQAIVPCEEGSGMAVYEVSFQAAGKSVIIYPNANRFTPEHSAFWKQTEARPRRLYRDYYFACAYAPLHELIHTVQHDTFGATTSSLIWKKEFDACRAQMNFMAAVAHSNPDLYPPGLLEEIVLWYAEISYNLEQQVDPEVNNGFEKWRDTCGREDPTAEDAQVFLATNRKAGYYLKARLAIEAYDAAATFGLYFDTYHGPERIDMLSGDVPPELLIDAKQTLRERVCRPLRTVGVAT